MKKIIKIIKSSVFILLIMGIIAYLIKFLLNVIAANLLTKEMYGDLMLGIKTFMLASSLLLLGTNSAAKKFLSKYLDKYSDKNATDYIAWNFRLVSKSISIFTIILTLFLLLLILFHLIGINEFSSYHLAVYLLFLSPIGAVASLLSSYLQCNKNVYLSYLFGNIAKYVLFIILFSLSFYLLQIAPSNFNLWLITLFVFSAICILEYFIFIAKVPVSFSYIISRKNIRNLNKLDWQKVSYTLIINNIVFLTLSVIDIYIVEIFLAQEDLVGEYSVALTLSSIFFTLSYSMYSFITPNISKYIDNDINLLEKFIKKGVLVSFIVSLIVLFIYLFYDSFLLSIFGKEYINYTAEWVLIILAIGSCIGGFSRTSVLLLCYGGYEKKMLYFSISEIFILVVLAIPMTIYCGVIGTAIATSTSIILKTLSYIIYVKIKLRCKPLGFF